MKLTFNKALYIMLIQTIIVGSVFADKINTPKSLRLEGETKREMIQRLFKKTEQADVYARRRKAIAHKHEVYAELAKQEKALDKEQKAKRACECCGKRKHCKNFKNFKGYWIFDSIDDFNAITLLEFFEDTCGRPMLKFYDGTQKNIRERNSNDIANEFNPGSTAGSVVPVQILGPKSVRIFNNGPILSSDDLASTFRIQDADNDLAYVILWTNWDGTGDSPNYGFIENLSQFRRLPERPDIQLNRLPSTTDWTNPVEIFNYIVDYYALMGEPQKTNILNQVNYIGWPAYEELAQTMLTTGVKHSATVSTAYRGGNYIGVWRTQFPDDFPITTIHTQELSGFNGCSKINISGFQAEYAILNGSHLAAAYPPFSTSVSTPNPWQDESSREHFVHIQFDSSALPAYNPSKHGVARLEAQHGPITPDIGYREFIAAVADFMLTSFGSSTHTGMRAYVFADTGISVPESFEELKEALSEDAVDLTSSRIRNRTFVDNGFNVYWDPYVLGTPLTFPSFNLNDPFGLGLIELDEYFNYDITLENYLDKETVRNIFFTITGPELIEQPITSMLKDIGYSSNGSTLVWQSAPYKTFPEPLKDTFGEHEWMQYNYALATNSTGIDDFASEAFFGGIIDKKLTGDKTVAYIRIQSEDAFDAPLYELTVRSLAFNNPAFSSTFESNFISAWATLLADLNAYTPDRYILDIRVNAGGFAGVGQSIAALFGDIRPAGQGALAFPGNGSRDPLILPGSGIQTVFNSIPDAPQNLLSNEAAAVFPASVVRSDNRKIEVIVLTSSRSASGGDVFPHFYLGPDPDATVHDLGGNVTSRIIGDIDGRLFSGIKGFDAPPIDPLSQNLVDSDGNPVTAVYLFADAGLLYQDRHGYIVNETLGTRPNPVLPAWYDQTEWQDIGVRPNLIPYPLPANANGETTPVYNPEDGEARKTWRDIWLENAIVN